MARSTIKTTIFLILVVADVSNASSFWKLRYLADESPTKDNTTAAAPANSSFPSPSSGAKKSDPKADSPSKLDPKSLNQTDSATPPSVHKESKASPELKKVSPPPQKEMDGRNNSSSSSSSNSTKDKSMENTEEKKENVDSEKNTNNTHTGKGVEAKEQKEEKKTNGDKTDSNSGIVETCDGVANSCTDGNFLSACIKGSNELVVLVQNSGGKTLKVSLSGPSDKSKEFSVPKHGTEKIKISLTISKSSKLVLSAGKGDCELLVNPPVSEGNFILNLPSYDKLMTPVNGAYFLIVTAVIFCASWACCMCRKRRRHDGIPYQELEMGLPETMAAAELETAEGWDQGWDDDWDEDKAVKSPAARHVPNISANGLTARSANRDGWENDWDD